jgi:hypothetical protein
LLAGNELPLNGYNEPRKLAAVPLFEPTDWALGRCWDVGVDEMSCRFEALTGASRSSVPSVSSAVRSTVSTRLRLPLESDMVQCVTGFRVWKSSPLMCTNCRTRERTMRSCGQSEDYKC